MLRKHLESAALRSDFSDTEPIKAWESEIEVSKAVSLKRIADSLVGIDLSLIEISRAQHEAQKVETK